MTVDQSKLNFWSDANYMKRDDELSGSASLTLGAFQSTVTKTINYNYGYIPFFEVYVDFTGDGTIWAGEKVDKWTDTSLGVSVTNPTLQTWTTLTTLTINLYNDTSPTASGSRTVYWLLYKDYGDVKTDGS